ncbi:carbohydrate sulfotransferase 5-like [Ylistrum balloti]|uniref:carbohydrate sulfotransferase 5-like n=1 Tax=Ylistrum balloti TaxID=509963 RepID=UPI002905B64B|nr:carbohydrate sulfotransferase 5-like [Ylistrum balloti]
MRFISKFCHRKKISIVLILSVIGLWLSSTRRSTDIWSEAMEDKMAEMTYTLQGYNETIGVPNEHQTGITKINDKYTPVTKILILTYMRSGSSFVAESLQQGYTNTFYSFEPFWEIYKKGYITPDKVCKRTNRCSMISNPLQQPGTAISILKDIFECKLDSLPDEVLHSFSKFEQLADHKRLENCFPILKKHRNGKLKQKTIERMSKTRSKCISYLENKCRSSAQRIVKSIRISFQLAKDIFKNIKHLKVIHLIRDPRAILQSRRSLGEISSEGFVPNTKQLCHRMSRDIDEAEALLDSYPDRVFPLRYECLAEKPESVLRKIYRDMLLPFNSKTEEWIESFAKGKMKATRNSTHNVNYTTEMSLISTSIQNEKMENLLTSLEEMEASERENIKTGYNVFKANSLHISRGWRHNIPYSDVTLIDDLCSDLYGRMGARAFKSKLELEDLKQSDRYSTAYTDRYCTNLLN